MTPVDYRGIGAELKDLLDLENPPVAVSFMDTPPSGVRKNTEVVPSGCVFWIRGFKDTFYTDRKDHANCNIGSFTHGYLAPQDVSLDACVDINLFNQTGYFPSSEFGVVPKMSEDPNYVAYGPLDKIGFEPDVVLMVLKPEQAMLVGEAAKSPKLMGAPTCAAIPMAYNHHQICISLGCVTNRIRTGIKPSELVVTVPKSELPGFTEALRKRVKANKEVAQAVTAMLESSKLH
jgi:uncharacterized protein (DUF169 family)